MFQILGVFSEFERAMIVERVRSGIARSKSVGTVFGRPKVSAVIESKIRIELAKPDARRMGIKKIAKAFGVGVSVVQRVAAARCRENGSII